MATPGTGARGEPIPPVLIATKGRHWIARIHSFPFTRFARNPAGAKILALPPISSNDLSAIGQIWNFYGTHLQ
jgi:hypothetical protein